MKLKAWRAGKLQNVTARLAEFPRNELLSRGALGAMLKYGLELRRDRPMIMRVETDSRAALAGFERGQVIKKIGGTDVDSSTDALIALADQGLLLGKRIPVEVETAESSAERKTIRVQLLR